MTSLAKALLPSSRGRRGGRPEARRCPALAHGVGDAGDQRRLGADDDEVDAAADGQGGDAGAVEQAVGQASHRAIGVDAGVARGDDHGVDGGVGAPGRRTRACSRAPEPMTRTFTGDNVGERGR